MGVSQHRGAWEVRWRDGSGTRRAKRFPSEEAAHAYDDALREVSPAARRSDTRRGGSGVYSYATREGTRWRFVVRRSDGSQTSKRGFTSQRAAADARRRLVEQVERREVLHTTETFGRYWDRWLTRRRHYLEDGTWAGYEVNGRKRLLPAFADTRLGALSVDDVRAFVAEQAEAVAAGEAAAKTVNNVLVTLVVCLNDAVEDGLMVANPALRVERLPAAHIEREYLRLHEIPIYLDSCSDVYRPLAEVLIGSGVRISEALALRIGDLDLDESGGVIVVYRSRKKAAVGSTKSDRFRSVEIGPRTSLCCALRSRSAESSTLALATTGSYSSCRYAASSAARAAGRALASPRPWTGPRCRGIGTSRRSRTPPYATCRFTRCATPPPPRGWRRETR